MAPYKYDTPEPSPLVGSIADIIQKEGALQGLQATQLAEITAKSAAVRGANWGQAVQSLGQLPMQVMEQNRRDQIANMDALYKTQQMQVSQASLQDAQQQRARKYAAGLALNKAIGDAKDPDSGEVDPQKVVDAIGGNFPEETAAWAKSYNDMAAAHTARAKSQKADQEQEDIYVGRLAHDADSAADFVDRLATGQAAHYVSKKTLDRVTDDLAKTNAWDPLKGQYVKRASTLLGPVKLGDTLYDPITNKPMLSDEKAVNVPPGGTLVKDGKVVFSAPANAPTAVEAQKALAFAKSLYGDNATTSDLKIGDWRQFDANKKAEEAAAARSLHAANTDYDNAHPKPPPAPVELNDNQKKVAKDLASGSLTFAEFNRMYSSRSGQGGAVKEAIYGAARELNPTFSPAQFEAGYKMATNPQMTQRLVSINGLMPVVDRITTLMASAGNTDLPTLNKLIQAGNFQIGGKHVASLRQLQMLLGDEVGLALGVGSGSDLKTKLGLTIVDPTLGPKDFLESMQQLTGVLSDRRDTLLGTMGVYGKGDSAVPAAQPSGGKTVGKYTVTVTP
jgi:hypothetical protein